MNADFTVLKKCLCCASTTLLPILDLGAQPLANSYHTKDTKLVSYQLGVNLCTTCFHVQQFGAVNPDLLFKDYAYVSGTSRTLLAYFAWFAQEITTTYFPSQKAGSILDIACNDGSQLAAFKQLNWSIFGVDPAENLTETARTTLGHIICDYWNKESATAFGRTFDCLVAQNVFAHTANPLEFLETCKMVMHEDSKLFIQTSQAEMFEHGEFDTIYHEHISFFSARSMKTLAEKVGLIVEDVFITPIHGKSYVFVLSMQGDQTKIKARIAQEQTQNRYNLSTYTQFKEKAFTCVTNLTNVLNSYKDTHAIVGYGAAAKGNTVLNFGHIELDYIVDDNPRKQNLLTPGMNIPIFSRNKLTEEKKPIVLVPLAWNFFTEIKENVKKLRPGYDDIFITYFPEVTVHS